METTGNIRLQIIQGDSFDRQVYVEGVETDKIEGIYFTCEKLGICKKLVLTKDSYFTLSISAEESSKFPKIDASYDLTIKFIDDKIQTATYCSQISILPKINKVTYSG
mgnify:CR=1 FL=1|jgi:hypothetical protein